MKKTTTLSTVINSDVKKAAAALCKRKGMKLQFLIEQALIEKLEDEIDLEAYQERKAEPTIPLEDILSNRKKA